MLTDNEKKSLNDHFEIVSKAQGIEIEEVIKDAESVLAQVLKTPSAAGKSREYLLKRMTTGLDSLYANKARKGESMVFIMFGPVGTPKDWNAGEIAALETEIDRGGIRNLMKDGKVFTIEKNGEVFPLRTITTYSKNPKYIKDGKVSDEISEGAVKVDEMIPIEGEIWAKEDGGYPLFKDFRPTKNGNVNYDYGSILGKNYSLQVAGIGWLKNDPEDIRLIKFYLNNEQADADSDKFFFKKYECFTPYIASFEITEKSTAWEFILKNKTVSPLGYDYKDMDEFDVNLERFMDKIHMEYEKEAKTFLPYYLDGLINLEYYHNKTRKINDKGEAEKSDKGYDNTNFGAYAILRCYVSGMSEPSGKGVKIYLQDSTTKQKLSAWMGKYVYHPPTGLPCQCLMMIKTSRGNERFDWKTKTKVFDPEHADISVNVLSIAKLPGEIEIQDVEV